METLLKLIKTLVPNGLITVNTKGNGINITNLSSSVIETVEDTVSQLNEEIATLGINREAKFFAKSEKPVYDFKTKTESKQVSPDTIAIFIPKLRKNDSDTDLLSAMSK
tara:strand:+ start:236 stop:562 length:327 start_codon:yes stop_codon:yes gene_type:complete